LDFGSIRITDEISNLRSLYQIICDIHSQLALCLKFSESSIKPILGSALTMKSELEAFEADLFQSWIDYVDHEYVETSSNSLDSKIFEFDSETGKLSVGVSEKLIRVLRDIRCLVSLGFRVPASILTYAERMQKIFRYGTMLKQIANFYNTVDQEMLPFQRPMMVKRAMKFESLIKKPSMTLKEWRNVDDLDVYLKSLNDACNDVLEENRFLRSVHSSIIELLVKLMDLNLITESKEWKNLINMGKTRVASVEMKGYSPESMESWLIYLDMQLFKILDFRFKNGLNSLVSLLPTIHSELIMRQDSVCFKPPLEELRLKVAKEIKRYLSIPSLVKVVLYVKKFRITRIYDVGVFVQSGLHMHMR
jgi:dynein heavy chain 2